MGVYGCLSVPRSIDSVSIPQQSRSQCDAANSDTSGVESKCRVETNKGRDDGGQTPRGWRGRMGRRNQKVGGERREGRVGIARVEMEKERRMGLWSLWDCVQGQPSWFLRPRVPLCPLMSLYVQPCPWTQSHSHSQITSVTYIPE